MFKPSSRHPIALPGIETKNLDNAAFWNTTMSGGLTMSCDPEGIYIPHYQVEKLLQHPDVLTNDIEHAYMYVTALRANDAEFIGQWRLRLPIRKYHVANRLITPMSQMPYERIDGTEGNYLTIIEQRIDQNSLPVGRYIVGACTHYITVAHHERLMAEAVKGVRTDIRGIVAQEVRNGITEGVSLAINEQTATLKQVELEKENVAAQIAKLQREKENLDRIQRNIEAREKAEEARRIAREKAEEERRAAQSVRTTAGYVYLLKEVNGIHHKIGRTINPKNRLKTFSVKLPYQVEYVHVIQTDDMYTLEYELHTRYASKRVDGEWFLLDETDIAEIRAL